MSSFGNNSPRSRTLIQAEARKSFSFGLWIKDQSGRLLDISDTVIRLVVKKPRDFSDDDSTNLIENSTAELVSPTNGYARFNLQASDLDHKPGEYPFSIVLHHEGYSSVLAKGTLEILPNTEYSSVGEVYTPITPVTALEILLRGRVSVSVHAGETLAPGTTSFTIADHDKLDGIEEGAQVNVNADWNAQGGEPGFIMNKPDFGTAAYMDVEDLAVPPGGSPGEVLAKLSSSDFDVAWVQVQGGGGGGGSLDPEGVLSGKVPMANGADGWSWEYPPDSPVESVAGKIGAVTLNQDDVADSASRLAMTPAERQKLSDLSLTPSWNDVVDKPTLGTASAQNVEAFLQPGEVDGADITSGVVNNAHIPQLSALRGFSAGTTAPTGGSDGDVYFQYT